MREDDAIDVAAVCDLGRDGLALQRHGERISQRLSTAEGQLQRKNSPEQNPFHD